VGRLARLPTRSKRDMEVCEKEVIAVWPLPGECEYFYFIFTFISCI
jgi:hypothetical protein